MLKKNVLLVQLGRTTRLTPKKKKIQYVVVVCIWRESMEEGGKEVPSTQLSLIFIFLCLDKQGSTKLTCKKSWYLCILWMFNFFPRGDFHWRNIQIVAVGLSILTFSIYSIVTPSIKWSQLPRTDLTVCFSQNYWSSEVPFSSPMSMSEEESLFERTW